MNKCALRPIVHASLSGAECIRTQTHKGTSKEDTAYSAYPILHNQIIPTCAPASCSKETKSLTSASDLKALRSSHHTETKQLARITHRAPGPGGNSHLHNIWKGFGIRTWRNPYAISRATPRFTSVSGSGTQGLLLVCLPFLSKNVTFTCTMASGSNLRGIFSQSLTLGSLSKLCSHSQHGLC